MHVIGLENGKRRVDSGVLRKIISIVISEVKNDRPVTLLPACDKVFEKLLSQQVTAFARAKIKLKSNSIPKKAQHWNIAYQSYGKLEKSNWWSSYCGDTIYRHVQGLWFVTSPIVLEKAERIWILNVIHRLNTVLLYWRKYRVKIGTEITSEWKEVSRGCPQG